MKNYLLISYIIGYSLAKIYIFLWLVYFTIMNEKFFSKNFYRKKRKKKTSIINDLTYYSHKTKYTNLNNAPNLNSSKHLPTVTNIIMMKVSRKTSNLFLAIALS